MSEYWEFMDKYNPAARKRHRCCECCGWIEPGEKYERVAGKWEGDFLVYKTCSGCAGLRNELNPEGDYTYCELWADLSESSNGPAQKRWLSNAIQRGAPQHDNWMTRRLAELEPPEELP